MGRRVCSHTERVADIHTVYFSRRAGISNSYDSLYAPTREHLALKDLRGTPLRLIAPNYFPEYGPGQNAKPGRLRPGVLLRSVMEPSTPAPKQQHYAYKSR